MIKRTGRPGYLQVADDLRQQIQRGTLAPGDVLPSTAQLAARYEVSLSVVKAALSVLRAEGLIVGQQGKGVFVRDRDQVAGEPGTPASEAAVGQLADLRSHVGKLAERIAALEAAVFPEERRPRRPRD